MDCAGSAQDRNLFCLLSGDLKGVFHIFQVKRGRDGGNSGSSGERLASE